MTQETEATNYIQNCVASAESNERANVHEQLLKLCCVRCMYAHTQRGNGRSISCRCRIHGRCRAAMTMIRQSYVQTCAMCYTVQERAHDSRLELMVASHARSDDCRSKGARSTAAITPGFIHYDKVSDWLVACGFAGKQGCIHLIQLTWRSFYQPRSFTLMLRTLRCREIHFGVENRHMQA